MPAGYKLFTPLKLADDLVLNNRVLFAPLTRGRSGPTRIPNEDNQLYYEQRAGAGLIFTEATAVSEQGFGWYGAPGLYNKEQAEGWAKVVKRVHDKGGKIFLQLWHMGRQGHSSFNSKKELVSASAIGLTQGQTKNVNGEAVPYEVPRVLETDEIAGIVQDYKNSAELAKSAGFDGVEIHGANGYLIDQFLQSSSNKRTDKYGGSIENRYRFLSEIVEAIKEVYPSNHIGVRLSPNGSFGGMGSEDNFKTFSYVIEQLAKHNLSYIALLDGFGFGYHDKDRLFTLYDAKILFKGPVVAQNSYTRDIAEGAVRSGAADAVGFGRLYISNPDLAERFENDWPLNPDANYDDYWNSSRGPSGYIDFPAYKDAIRK